jgi:hypothetical protein
MTKQNDKSLINSANILAEQGWLAKNVAVRGQKGRSVSIAATSATIFIKFPLSLAKICLLHFTIAFVFRLLKKTCHRMV